MKLILILGNQLFDPKYLKKHISSETLVFMREDSELASYYKFHQQKISFFFAAMRSYADELKEFDFKVHYENLDPQSKNNFETSLESFIRKNKITKVVHFEIEDKFFENRISLLLRKMNCKIEVLPSPMFLTSREEFKKHLGNKKKPFMKTFYESQRKRLDILVKNGQPVGGHWSFDTENRKALPKKITPPPPEVTKKDSHMEDAIAIVEKVFSTHPGRAAELWLPVTRTEAQQWLKKFLKERLEQFGPYEDALPAHSDLVFHSALTPFLNIGLLTPQEVIDSTLKYSEKNAIPLASLEGFIRQIIGWREFIRGIYQNFSEIQETRNFWQHTNKLKPTWYQGHTGIPVLDRAIERCLRRGYNHHIERLMVIGNLMLLLEVDPKEAHRWFMEMYIDSSEWVMGPNVYGMALFADGGIFATKPYICGSNYWIKMSGDAKGDWCDGVDGLYWQFILKHRDFFAKNPRLNMMVKTAGKISPERWKKISQAAQALKEKLVSQK
jgi:deoxyribodipyrimidine photolyase-related protein